MVKSLPASFIAPIRSAPRLQHYQLLINMADDTRQTENSPAADNATQEPEKRRRRPRSDFPATQSSKMWEAFGNPDQPANSMPGGTYNSAGGKPKEVGWTDALSFEVFNSDKRPPFWKTGCARDSILVGMGSGAGVGGLHFILRGKTLALCLCQN